MILLAMVLFVAAVLLQALLEGYETGFVSVNPIRVRYLAEEEDSSRARRLLRYLQHPDNVLAVLLIASNLMVVTCTLSISVLLSVILPAHWMGFIENMITIVIVAPVLLLFCQILPKSVFRSHPTQLSLVFLPLIHFVYLLLSPLAVPVAVVTRALFRTYGGEDQHLSPLMASLEDVRVLVDEGVDHGTIEREEQEMIHSVIDLQTMTAKEIMVPRIAIQALPRTATRTELVKLFAETGRTRIPVYNETVDTILGTANAYAILTDAEPECEDIARFISPVMHVPDSIRVKDLFREMKKVKQHIAIVTDEYGGTDGLITMEDILEEIFGEIQDEYDHEVSRIHKVGPNAYVVDARLALEEVADATGIAVEDDTVETVGGWIMHVAGRIPAQGEVIQHERFRITILAAAPTHVSRVRLEILSEPLENTDGKERQSPVL